MMLKGTENNLINSLAEVNVGLKKTHQGNKKCKWFQLAMKTQFVRINKSQTYDVGKKHKHGYRNVES